MTEIPLLFKRAPAVVAATVGEKSFLLHIEEWVYLELNESGSRIWDLLDGQRPFPEMIELLGRDFHVDRELCADDTMEFLNDLEAKHFVTREG